MASLLERISAGPVRNKSTTRPAPYTRPKRGDIDAAWTHDLYEQGSLSARLDVKPAAPRLNLPNITQKALREATGLSIKGASTSHSANVIEVSNLLPGTTPSDVAAIFASCGEITQSRLVTPSDPASPSIRLTYKSPAHAAAAVTKYNNQPADGKILSVRIVGASSSNTGLSVRLGGPDGLGLVRQERSVDVLISTDDSGSKMRSDSLTDDPRAQVLVAPPGANPAEYTQTTTANPRHGASRRGGPRGGRGRRGKRGGLEHRMDTD
ncbi:hypothetical protein H0H92_010241 [Tricholoma furcatifolium]|nr:hypothetical protein H0H92_010241 [Tricholoma furcatifolium]